MDSWENKFVDRTYKTYRSRLGAHKRLRIRGILWDAALVSLSTSLAIAAILLVAEPDLYGNAGPSLFAVLALLTLVASLVVTNRNYAGRSRDLFDNYREIQRISAEAERLVSTGASSDHAEMIRLNTAYQDTLDESENHVESDFVGSDSTSSSRATSSVIGRMVSNLRWEKALSVLPIIPIVISLLVLYPVLKWLIENS